MWFDPFSNDTFYTGPYSKSLQMTILNSVKNGRKFSKRVENTVEMGEIACHNQFLLFHSVFKRFVLQTRKKQGLF